MPPTQGRSANHAAYDPLPADGQPAPAERWWGDHVGELRWQLELARLLVDPVLRGAGIPRGDGAPAMLIPGFMAGDSSLQVMRGWLGRIGYDPHPSGISVN